MSNCEKCGNDLETSAYEYRKAVNSIADDLKERFMAGEYDEDDFNYQLHEEIDGSWWVIYTHAAMAVLRHSNNDGAYVAEYGWEEVASDGGIDWSKLAYGAMYADVNEACDVSAWVEERDEQREEQERKEAEAEAEEEQDEEEQGEQAATDGEA